VLHHRAVRVDESDYKSHTPINNHHTTAINKVQFKKTLRVDAVKKDNATAHNQNLNLDANRPDAGPHETVRAKRLRRRTTHADKHTSGVQIQYSLNINTRKGPFSRTAVQRPR